MIAQGKTKANDFRNWQIALQKSAVISFFVTRRSAWIFWMGASSLDLGDRGYQLGHPSEVLSDGSKRKLVLCAARTSQ